MKKLTTLLAAVIATIHFSHAQSTAMDFEGHDCNGNYHHLFADLDAGKAVVVFFYMPSCGSCPPPAQMVQAMANNINAVHPGMVTAYAFPFQNSTTCTYSASWVSTNALSLYAPMDSGATGVAYYGGFGMPTVVLLGGGTDHRVMFATQSFSTSDTTVMRDSIIAHLNATGINDLPAAVSSFSFYPNPATDILSVNLNLKERADIIFNITDITGKQVLVLMSEKINSGSVRRQFKIDQLPGGNYFVRLNVNGKTITEKLNIVR